MLLNSTPDKFPAHFISCAHKNDSLLLVWFPCQSSGGTVAFLSLFCHAGHQGAEVQECHTYILCYSWLQAEPHCLGRLWSKVWPQFSVHTRAKDLFKVSVSMPSHTRNTEKRRCGGERDGEADLYSGALVAAWCRLLKQMSVTSSCRLSLHTNSKSVVSKPILDGGCAPLIPSLKSPTNKARQCKARQGLPICIATVKMIHMAIQGAYHKTLRH